MKIFQKKALIGLCGLFLSVGLIVLFACLSPSGNITELNCWGVIARVLSLLFLSSAVAFLFYILGDCKSAILIFILFAVMTLFRVLIEFTSQSSPSLSLFLIALLGIVFCVISANNQFKSNQYAINGSSALTKKEKQEQEKIEKQVMAINQEDEEFKKSIGYPEKSIIIATQMAGSLFQVIKTDDGLLFHHVGNILKGINDDKIVKDFTNVSLSIKGKKDFVLKIEEIDKVLVRIKDNAQIMNFGSLQISLKSGKKLRYCLVNLFEANELNQFFDAQFNAEIKIDKNVIKTNEVSEEDKIKMNRLNVFFFVFSIIASFVFGVYFSFQYKVIHVIFTTLCIVICLLPFVVYLMFPQYLSIKEKSRYDSSLEIGKLNIAQNVLMFPLLFALISMLDGYFFVYYNLVKLLIYSVILFVIFLIVFMLLSKEYKKEKSVWVTIVLVALFLCPAIVHKINLAYDFSPAEERLYEITDTPTWTNKKDETTYYLTFNYNGKSIKAEVSKDTYQRYNIGDQIPVIKKQGLLGIEKLILNLD